MKKQSGLPKIPLKPIVPIKRDHWFNTKAIVFTVNPDDKLDLKPKTVKEWAVCFWNMDIFIEDLPLLKATALLSVALSVLLGSLWN